MQQRCLKGIHFIDSVVPKDDVVCFKNKNLIVMTLAPATVADCKISGGELILEFGDEVVRSHEEDHLMEVRLTIHEPQIDNNPLDHISQIFRENMKGDVSSDKNLGTFDKLNFVVPRGTYDADFHKKFVRLHGASFNYTITYKNIQKAFFLPHPDNEKASFVIGFDKPLIQGNTEYKFALVQFKLAETAKVVFNVPEATLNEIDNMLEVKMRGAKFEVFTKIFKAFTKIPVIRPGDFYSTKGEQCVNCSHGPKAGQLYVLNRSFLFVPKPIVHIKFEDIQRVELLRLATNTQSKGFDIEVFTRMERSFFFTGIDKNEADVIMKFMTTNKVSTAVADEELAEAKHNYAGDDEDVQSVDIEEEELGESDDDDDDVDYQPREYLRID